MMHRYDITTAVFINPDGEWVKTSDAMKLSSLLEELYALVNGECPSLLNEDSGGNSRLDLEIKEAITWSKS